MEELLEKFPKAVLIKFILKDTRFHVPTKEYLEGMLLYYQWDQEEEAIERERAEIASERAKFDGDVHKFMELNKRSQRATARWYRNDKIYKKSQKLRGF